MIKFYWHFSVVALLCLMGMSTSVMAQESHTNNLRWTLHVKTKIATNSNINTLTGKEANEFDAIDFLEKNHGEELTILGYKSTDTESIRYHFKTVEVTEQVEGKVYYKEQVKSVKAMPFLGVATTGTVDFNGVEILRILDGTAADNAGLQIGDIITHINGFVMSSNCDLNSLIASLEVGQPIEINVERDDQKIQQNAVLGQRLSKVITWTPESAPTIVNPTAFDKPTEVATLDVFPNPSNGLAQLNYTADSKAPLTILITDVSGREVYREEINRFDGIHHQYLNLNKEADGLYFINIIQGTTNKIEKLIIQKSK